MGVNPHAARMSGRKAIATGRFIEALVDEWGHQAVNVCIRDV